MTQPEIIKQTQQAIMRGQGALLDSVPALIGKIIRDGIWREQRDRDGKPFETFAQFCEYKLWYGLETKVDDLADFCKRVPEVSQLLQRELLGANGKTVRQVAEETGLSKSAVHEKTSAYKRTNKNPSIRITIVPGTNPATAAARIREKLGDEFADSLREAL